MYLMTVLMQFAVTSQRTYFIVEF